eukprot:m.24824 g.24824  ORF g.24824 m.24824 type:complete len:197 (+) comp7649_c0_seq4:380-970(+)
MSAVLKSFVSEKEIETVRQKKQEEWEKTRTADQPLERPEEVHDPRTLYERLQANKIKKDEEFEEALKFKNQIYKGLDADEFEHIEKIKKREYEETVQRYREEGKQLKKFREEVAKQQADQFESNTRNAVLGTSKRKRLLPPKKTQQELLAGLIRPKKTKSDSNKLGMEKLESKKVLCDFMQRCLTNQNSVESIRLL